MKEDEFIYKGRTEGRDAGDRPPEKCIGGV